MEDMKAATRSPWSSILLGVFLALLLITAWETVLGHGEYTVTVTTNSGSGHTVRIRDGRERLEFKVLGEIEMTPDERGIARLGDGAYLAIEERRGRRRRRLEATPGPGGVPEIAWFVDGWPAELDGDGRRWLARSLRKLCRISGQAGSGRLDC